MQGPPSSSAHRGTGRHVRSPRTIWHGVLYGLLGAAVLFAAALYAGWRQGMFWSTLPLIGTALVLEAQPGTVLSIALGFHPLDGALISVIANLMPMPLIILNFQGIIQRWPWAERRVRRAQGWARRYGHYGVPVLFVLSPFLGAYACVAIGYGMGWRPLPTVGAIMAGMLTSVLLIAYGGHWVAGLFTH